MTPDRNPKGSVHVDDARRDDLDVAPYRGTGGQSGAQAGGTALTGADHGKERPDDRRANVPIPEDVGVPLTDEDDVEDAQDQVPVERAPG